MEPTGGNMSDVYNKYKKMCAGKDKHLSRFTFDAVIHDKKISFQPQKDRCDTCIRYEVQQISEIEYIEHIIKKEAARKENKRQGNGKGGEVYYTNSRRTVRKSMP